MVSVCLVYKDVWKPSIGDKRVAKREFNNSMDKHAKKMQLVHKFVRYEDLYEFIPQSLEVMPFV